MGIVVEVFIVLLVILLVITLILVAALTVYSIILTAKLRKIAASVQKTRRNIRGVVTDKLRAAAPLLMIDFIKRFTAKKKSTKQQEGLEHDEKSDNRDKE